MMTLSGGKRASKEMNPQSFSNQHFLERGFFVSWHELISGYPTFSQRVLSLMSLKANEPERVARRHPLAYLFAFFTFSAGRGGTSVLLTVAILGILAVVMIPQLAHHQVNAVAHTLSELPATTTPTWESDQSTWSAADFILRGDQLLDQEKYGEAFDLYSTAIALDANAGMAYLNRGVARIGLEQYREALADLERALELEPTEEKTIRPLIEIAKSLINGFR